MAGCKATFTLRISLNVPREFVMHASYLRWRAEIYRENFDNFCQNKKRTVS